VLMARARNASITTTSCTSANRPGVSSAYPDQSATENSPNC
jgi:hypothetical protein